MTQPNNTQPLDRTGFPGVPESVTDLWSANTYKGTLEPADVQAVLKGASAIVNAMAGGNRYAVTLSGATATAGTAYDQRQVLITTAALQDQRLSVLERLGITTALAVHEAGHGRLSEPMGKAVDKWLASAAIDGATKFLVKKFSNVIEDVRLERLSDERWPAYEGLFPLAMWWVAQRYPSGGVKAMPTTQGEALNLCIAATRYDPVTAWSADPAVQAERTWWQAWAERAAEQHKPAGHIAAIREALEHIAALPTSAPNEPEPKGDQPDEDGDEGGEPGEGGESDEDAEGEPGEGEGSAPCTCGCSVVEYAPVKAGCTDEHCKCHGGQPDEDGESGSGEGDGEADEDESDEDGSGGDGEADDEAEDDAEGDEDGSGTGAGGLDADESGDPGEAADGEGGDGAIEGDGDGDATGEQPGETEADGPGGDGASNTGGEADRDALADPLPLEMDEPGALTADESLTDAAVAAGLRTEADALSRTEIVVTHPVVNEPRWDALRQSHAVIDQPNEWYAANGHVGTSPMVQAALRQAFTARKASHENKTVANSGQVSARRLYRARTGVGQVFTRREGISPDRLDVHFVVDTSSSMSGERVLQAQTLTANMVEALARVVTVRTHVWGFCAVGTETRLLDVLDSRKGHKVGRLAALQPAGGTPTGTAIRAIGERVLKERHPRERSLIVVLTDGQPGEHLQWVRAAVDTMQSKRVGVLAVALAPGLSEGQRITFGADNTVIWTGDWRRLGRDLGKALGRLA